MALALVWSGNDVSATSAGPMRAQLRLQTMLIMHGIARMHPFHRHSFAPRV